MSLNPGIYDRFFFYKGTTENITDYLFRKFIYGGPGVGGVSTSGSSTTITGATGGTLVKPPLNELTAGDIVVFNYGGAVYIRKVVSVGATFLTIVVDTAIDLSNGTSGWYFFKRYQGTTDADGWIYIGNDTNRTVFFSIPTLVNVLDIVVQEKLASGLTPAPITVFQRTVTVAADVPFPLAIGEDAEFIRVGVRSAAIATDPDEFTISLGARPVR